MSLLKKLVVGGLVVGAGVAIFSALGGKASAAPTRARPVPPPPPPPQTARPAPRRERPQPVREPLPAIEPPEIPAKVEAPPPPPPSSAPRWQPQSQRGITARQRAAIDAARSSSDPNEVLKAYLLARDLKLADTAEVLKRRHEDLVIAARAKESPPTQPEEEP